MNIVILLLLSHSTLLWRHWQSCCVFMLISCTHHLKISLSFTDWFLNDAVRSCQCRLRFGKYVDVLSSEKRFTHSTRQESRPAHRIVIPERKQLQAGCIIYSVSSHVDTSTTPSLPFGASLIVSLMTKSYNIALGTSKILFLLANVTANDFV